VNIGRQGADGAIGSRPVADVAAAEEKCVCALFGDGEGLICGAGIGKDEGDRCLMRMAALAHGGVPRVKKGLEPRRTVVGDGHDREPEILCIVRRIRHRVVIVTASEKFIAGAMLLRRRRRSGK
jgi:hypothetical protein